VSVAGALFGVAVDQAQQRVDVEVDLLVAAGEQLDAVRQLGQMRPEHRFELASVPEGELTQQSSDRRRRVDVAEQGGHAAGA
jgi:soluble P-type ATPase